MKGFQRGKSVKQRNIEVNKGIKKSSLTKLLHKQKKKEEKKNENQHQPNMHKGRFVMKKCMKVEFVNLLPDIIQKVSSFQMSIIKLHLWKINKLFFKGIVPY